MLLMNRFWQFFTIPFIAVMFMLSSNAGGTVLTCGEFQIEVPNNWEKLSVPDPVLLAFTAKDSDATLFISFFPISPAPTGLNDSRVRDVSRGMKKRALKLLLETETNVAGKPACYLDFEAATPSGVGRFSVWNVLAESGIYSAMLINVSDEQIKRGIIDSAKLLAAATPPETPEDVKLREKIYDLAITLVIALAALAYFMKPRTHKPG